MSDDLYALLGIARTASAAEIKQMYRKLARKLHPDKNPGNAEAEEQFKRVSYAYEILSDPDKRKLYDEFGEVGLREGFDADEQRRYRAWQAGAGGRRARAPEGEGQFVDLEDLLGGRGLEDLFGGFRGGRQQPGRGPDLHSELALGFAEAIRGGERELTFSTAGEPPKTLKVRFPPGARDGEKIRLRGQGVPRRGKGPAGDLVLTLRVGAHPHFRREEDDLHLDLPVTLAEAYRGAKIRVPTPDGDVTLLVPPGTQPGAQLRLRGKGVRRAKRTGDLYVHIYPHLPPGEEGSVGASFDALDPLYGDLRAGIRF